MNAHDKLYALCDTHGVDVYSIKLYGMQVWCVLVCVSMCGNESKPHVNENAKQLFTETESPWIVLCCILDFDCIHNQMHSYAVHFKETVDLAIKCPYTFLFMRFKCVRGVRVSTCMQCMSI